MIEKMKRITVFCQKEKALSVVLSLRDLGLMHIKDVAQKSIESENKEKDNHRGNSGFLSGSHGGLYLSVYRG